MSMRINWGRRGIKWAMSDLRYNRRSSRRNFISVPDEIDLTGLGEGKPEEKPLIDSAKFWTFVTYAFVAAVLFFFIMNKLDGN